MNRPIMLRTEQVKSIRDGSRTHLFLPATFVPGRRIAVGEEARQRATAAAAEALRMPTPWVKLQPGDVLWVQEERAFCRDKQDPANPRWFYKADLLGGHIPLPYGARLSRYETGTESASEMTRELSRYCLAVERSAVVRAQAISWEEVRGEGKFDPLAPIHAWWNARYGVALGNWLADPEVCSLSFRFVDANVETGERWDPKLKRFVPPAASGTVYP